MPCVGIGTFVFFFFFGMRTFILLEKLQSLPLRAQLLTAETPLLLMCRHVLVSRDRATVQRGINPALLAERRVVFTLPFHSPLPLCGQLLASIGGIYSHLLFAICLCKKSSGYPFVRLLPIDASINNDIICKITLFRLVIISLPFFFVQQTVLFYALLCPQKPRLIRLFHAFLGNIACTLVISHLTVLWSLFPLRDPCSHWSHMLCCLLNVCLQDDAAVHVRLTTLCALPKPG
mmetsp:Transcript_42388/g.74331  ORF Transcript_42388/g.74331 Transcript_42388/m.74331 type:complete len:233 (-) Transcript_42388:552-1250(-)